MKLSINWLKDFVDINISAEELAEKLTSGGFEIDEIIKTGKGMEKVIVGRIDKLTKHENAEKLQICDIDLGYTRKQIVTAATNVFEGALVPVAIDGADLPCGVTINSTVMRGVRSDGMLCSGHELCIDDSIYEGAEINGIMIIKESEIGVSVAKVLGMDDVVLDVSVLANRPDCNSVLGLAREIATILDLPLKMPKLDYKITADNSSMDIDIQSSNCPRYMGAIVKDVKVTSSPSWMQARLKSVGINAINTMVDITNYVLMEIGQPMHAFDLAKVDKIVVRQANDEKFIALDEKEYDLNKDIMVIADSKKPLAIAGVMGGLESGVCDSTTDILLESATFNRASIRTTSRKLGLRSDSSARFERGVEPLLNELGLNRALSLIDSLGLGKIVKIEDNLNCKIENKNLKYNYNEVNAILGTNISKETMIQVLNKLNITTKNDGDILTSQIPSYRTDIERVADIAEEVIRICGLEQIGIKEDANLTQPETIIVSNMFELKKVLAQSGLFEIKSLSLNDGLTNNRLHRVEENAITLSNPLNDNLKVLRTNLLDGMLQTISYNIKHNNRDLKLFEIGHTFENIDGKPNEKIKMSVGMCGKINFFDIKKILEVLAINLGFKYALSTEIDLPYDKFCAGNIIVNNVVVGEIGHIHPKITQNYDIEEQVYALEIDLSRFLFTKAHNYQFKALSRFPAITRDLNFVVPKELSFSTLFDELTHSAGKLCTEVSLIDIYEGEQVEDGFKSMSFRFRYEKEDSTLTDAEVEQMVARLLRTLQYKLKVDLRR